MSRWAAATGQPILHAYPVFRPTSCEGAGRSIAHDAGAEPREPGEVRHVERQQVRRAVDVADRHEPGVMHLLPDNSQAAYESLPRRIDVRRLRKERERRLDTAAFASAPAADNPKPFTAVGRVATFLNSMRTCGVMCNTSPRRCSSSTAAAATACRASTLFPSRTNTFVSSK